MPDIPTHKLVQLAKRIGRQEHDLCPTSDRLCFRHRDIPKGYTPYQHTTDGECADCWLLWLLTGE